MFDKPTTAPHVRAADAQAQRFSRAKAHHHQVELAGREALDQAVAAGKALAEAKEQCGHGKWLSLIEKHWDGHRATVARYIRLYRNRSRVKDAGSIAEALRWLADDVDPEEEKEKVDAPQLPVPVEGEGAAGEEGQTPPVAVTMPDRTAEYVGQLVRTLVKARELLSEAYAGPARSLIDQAADGRRSILALTLDGGIVMHGKVDGVPVGPRRVSNDALDSLIEMATRAKAALANAERGQRL